MSAIYLAHQTGLAGFKKLVVLKTILPDIGGEEDFVGMFLEEARITAVFNHPNIAQVFELDTDDGQLFMAMEFVQGCTLVEMARACHQAKESIPIGLTLATVRDTALALHYAHNFTDARGRKQIVIHRDVAEKNIMVTYEGVTKLLDFGIAKALGRGGATSVGMVKGTSGYMSPEQIRGEPLDPRSDIFALGVVLHECLTGLRLFHGKTPEEGMMAALREEVQPPSKWNKEVPPELDGVVLRALQRDREKRFSTALEFARALERAALPGTIWHPEQCGELVTRHFADRRIETRRLLESAEFGAENTGEIRVQNVMAQVRASAEPRPSIENARKPSLISAPRPTMPREEEEFTRPGVVPAQYSAPPVPTDNVTSPARPKALRPSTPPVPQPVLKPGYDDEEDDDERSKTIPAAALNDEVKNLRAAYNRKNAATQASPAHQGPEPMREFPRSATGETLSITNKADPRDWDDDDGGKTAIAGPNELPNMMQPKKRPVPQPAPMRTQPDPESFQELEPVAAPRRTGLVVVLLILFALAVGGLLVLLDVIPLPGARRVGVVETASSQRLA
ncbi:MAG: hypothetical protein DI536_34520 [Archangium gephyra]|uniref:Protein kinase domain-containing protein n=1 Tax=Archangium gephyra TaxID=48 RepID=A0A2W5SMG4_9BACT|nr:MAG: hypothetical protein DI536_34520 [Archangium gephyra]